MVKVGGFSFDKHIEQTRSGLAVVANNLPDYYAEIDAVVPKQGRKKRVWTVYENEELIAHGATETTAFAKRMCAIHLKIAQELPQFDRLPPLPRTTVLLLEYDQAQYNKRTLSQ